MIDFDSTIDITQTDELIINTSKVIQINFDTLSDDGSAVIAGDVVEIFVDSILTLTYVLQPLDTDQGFYLTQLDGLSDGSEITAIITDIAGNISDVSTALEIDTVPLVITSGTDASAINENSAVPLVIYTATIEGEDFRQFELSEDSDADLSINSDSGEVLLTAIPDFEAKTEYSFSVIAIDSAGNKSEQSVTVDVTNLDEVAPTINSTDAVTNIFENSGAGQVIYTATADDSADVSTGVSFSLSDESDAAFTIDAATGEVTLVDNPIYAIQSEYTFEVIATDAAGNVSNSKILTLEVSESDDVPPTIISSEEASPIVENSGAGQIIYTALTDSSIGVTFSLTSDSDSALSISASTGEVTLSPNPDHEAQAQYSFAVIATDAAGNVSDPQSVTLAITNLDDFAPTITSIDTAVVFQNAGANAEVYQALADDRRCARG